MVTNYGIMLPFSRSQGSEVQTGAGLVYHGIDTAAQAGNVHLHLHLSIASVYMYVASVLQGAMK